MEILKYLCDDLIIIVPDNLKDKLLKRISSQKKFYSLKIFPIKDLKKSLFFDYDLKVIDYLNKEYNLNYYVAKEYLENIYFVEDKDYKSIKLNKLVSIKKDLLKKQLLIVDDKFRNLFINKKIIVYGFDVISKEIKLILEKIGYPYQIINETYDKKTQFVYHFNTIEDEIDCVCYQISNLLKQKVDINKIKLANINNDYNFTLSRYFKMYNIPLSLKNNESLFSLLSVKEFYQNYSNNYDLSKCLNEFINNYPDQTNIYDTLLTICNKAILLEEGIKPELLKFLLINQKLPEEGKNNCIEIIDIENYLFDKEEFVFVLSLNQGIYPKTYKDEEFFTDLEKEELLLDNSENLNVLSKEKFKILLNKSNNLILSYKDKTPFSSFNKSFILNEERIEVKEFKKDITISYSDEVDCLKLAKILDKTYQASDDFDAKTLINNYKISYKEYEHKFKSFSNQLIKDYIKNSNIALSYSSISNYFLCGFKYFLNNILKIAKQAKSKSIDIGNVFHKILQLSYEKDFDFEKTFADECNKINDVVTLFYLSKFKNFLKDSIMVNQDNFKDSMLNNILAEKKVEIKFDEPISIVFKGFIDKILYTEKNDKTYVAIIDYKTGNVDVDVKKVQYGLSLQLPIYLYLIKQIQEFKNIEVCGFYIQKVLPSQFKADEDYYNNIKKSIALSGYSNSSFAILSMLDPHFANSQMIKSMKVTKENEFYHYSKVLSSVEMGELALLVEEKIKEALNNICNCKFDINPKYLEGKNQSCKYCEFKDCCFVSHSDNVYLDNIKEESEGDEDGD